MPSKAREISHHFDTQVGWPAPDAMQYLTRAIRGEPFVTGLAISLVEYLQHNTFQEGVPSSLEITAFMCAQDNLCGQQGCSTLSAGVSHAPIPPL